MLLVTHFTIGLAIGRHAATPATAFLLGFLSHFVFDYIPHWDGIHVREDGKIYWKDRDNLTLIVWDIAITIAIALYAIWQGWLPWLDVTDKVFWSILGAVFPDFLWIPYHILGMRHPSHFFEFHKHIQRKAEKPPSILFQTALILLSLALAR